MMDTNRSTFTLVMKNAERHDPAPSENPIIGILWLSTLNTFSVEANFSLTI